MRKKLVGISLACIILVFAACNKDNTDIIAPVTVVPKVKTFTIMNGAAIVNAITVYYDNLGRRIKQTYSNGGKVDIIFTGNTMTQEAFSSNGVSQGTATFNLNVDGLSDSYFANATPTIIIYQSYNATKQLLSDITKNNGVTTDQKYYMYDNLGNLSADSTIATNGITIRTYEHYTDKISTTENSNFGADYIGASNKNSLKKLTLKNPANIITTYDYSIPEMDAQGRVTKQSYTSGGNTIQYTYTYY